jgi:hypothetical protein
MSEKAEIPREKAIQVARQIGRVLQPACQMIAVAGSLRRGCKMVDDVELVYIPRKEIQRAPSDFFMNVEVNLADQAIAKMEGDGILARRKNVHGSTTFGEKNKLMVHVKSGISVDLFSLLPEPCICGRIRNAEEPFCAEQDSVPKELRCMRDPLPIKEPEGLQQEMQRQASMGRAACEKEGSQLPNSGVQDLPKKVPGSGILEGAPVLLSSMREDCQSSGNAGKEHMERPQGLQEQGGIHFRLRSGASGGGIEIERDAAPACNGAPPWKAAKPMGNSSSSQRSETRQSVGQSPDCNPPNPSRGTDLSALPATVYGEVTQCPICHGSGVYSSCWWNYLVCRTGPKESNIAISSAAKKRGWDWNPYGSGFSRNGRIVEMKSERDVFKFVGLPWPGNRVEIEL